MKKALTAVALTLAATTASAGDWIYSGTGYNDVDAYAKGALSKSYLPVVESVFGERGSLYAMARIIYKESTGQCVTSFLAVTALDTEPGGGEVTIYHDSPVQTSLNYAENQTVDQCLRQFKKTVDENFAAYSNMLANR